MSTTKKRGLWFLVFFISGLVSVFWPFKEDNILYHISGLIFMLLISISLIIFIAFLVSLWNNRNNKFNK
jgi:hypothetical protein